MTGATPLLTADPFLPYRRVGNVMVLAMLVLVLAEFAWNFSQPTSRDFISFWGAAKLALGGHAASAYDKGALHAVQAAAARFDGGEMPFPYPPAFLLLVLPFGLLPFAAAMVAWVAATFILFMAAVRRLYPESGWLAAAFPVVFANAAIGQNAFLTAAIFIGGLALLPRRPFVAGLLLGCLVLKPQLALMLPVAMIAGRQWRAIVGGALSAAAVMLAGWIAFGPAASSAWAAQLPLYASIARDGLVGWQKLASVYAACRQVGVGVGIAMTIHAAVAVAAAIAVAQIWRSDADHRCKIAIVAAAALLASPYLFVYDSLLLVPALLWLAVREEKVALVAGLWCLPIVTIIQTAEYQSPINLNPAVPIILVALVYRHWRNDEHAGVTAANLQLLTA